tara:strand:+ start:2576 stop:2791 length:216 start_codon:yes stop_codon:yes gene_type:complete
MTEVEEKEKIDFLTKLAKSVDESVNIIKDANIRNDEHSGFHGIFNTLRETKVQVLEKLGFILSRKVLRESK